MLLLVVLEMKNNTNGSGLTMNGPETMEEYLQVDYSDQPVS